MVPPSARGACSFLRVLLLLAVRVTLDVLLPLTGDGQGALWNVLGDRRASASVRAVTDVERRHQGRVHAGLHALSELRAVLLTPVVVGGDGAGAEIAVIADVRVPDVGQMRHLCALADVGVLDLDEGAD